MPDRPPLPPFDRESALTKVQAAEDAWNTRDPERVAGAYTADSAWRNRDSFFAGRAAAARLGPVAAAELRAEPPCGLPQGSPAPAAVIRLDRLDQQPGRQLVGPGWHGDHELPVRPGV